MKKHWFANLVVAACLGVSLVVTACVIWEYHRLDAAMPADVVRALLTLWGGELLILAARQVLGSDALGRGEERSPPARDADGETEHPI